MDTFQFSFAYVSSRPPPQSRTLLLTWTRLYFAEEMQFNGRPIRDSSEINFWHGKKFASALIDLSCSIVAE
jgi:hypothetical protein